MGDSNKLSAVELAAMVARGEVTAERIMADCLARVDARDDDVRAWAYLDREYALEAARRADQIRPERRGPLHGIPVGIKDIIDTEDMPTEHGSALFQGRTPDADAQVVAMLRAAGAIIMGKTVTTELANTNPSKTRNPHNLGHTPGGSSSGSGAGVADYQVPLALGTQTGGSVIRPASFNGIYGLKPTLGWFPRQGVLMQSHTLDTVGVYGRSLADLALLCDTLGAPEVSDAQSYRGSRGSARKALNETDSDSMRLAFLETPGWHDADEGARAAIESVVQDLGSRCRVEDLPTPWDRALSLHGAIFAVENLYYYGDHFRERPELMSEKLRARMSAASDISARDYVEALQLREVIYAQLEGLLAQYDAVLCLAAAGPAPRGFETTGTPAFNSPWTYLGVPCISLPKLQVAGLPLGVQLVGCRGGEPRLFRAAKWLDDRLGSAPTSLI